METHEHLYRSRVDTTPRHRISFKPLTRLLDRSILSNLSKVNPPTLPDLGQVSHSELHSKLCGQYCTSHSNVLHSELKQH